MENLSSKKFQYKFAKEIGIPTPKTYYPNSRKDIERIGRLISYPCLIKPAHSQYWGSSNDRRPRNWKKVITVGTAEQLVEAYYRVSSGTVEFIVQEKIQGGDDQLYALYTCLDSDSQPLGVFVRQKLRQWPIEAGDGSYSVSVYEPEVVDLGLKLLRAANYQGLANIEFKKDSKDSKFKLVEVNIRSALQIQLAVDS